MPQLKGFPAGGLVLALSLIAGCSRSEQQAVPVSGVVTLDGKPVPNVLVVFSPTRGELESPNICPSSSGVTDEEGRFELETLSGRGAVVGEHVVTLICRGPTPDAEPSGPPGPPKLELPAEASDRSLRFVVPATGADEAQFALESNQQRPTGSAGGAGLVTAIPGGVRETAEGPGASRNAAGLYAATVSVWFASLVGCFFWWRINLRLVRERE